MSIYTISDLHLAINNKEKSMEVFTGWEHYVERLEKNWNNLVQDKDTVIIAGDISWALKLEESVDDLKFIDKLKGKKLLIKGNHDLWWSTRKKLIDILYENDCKTIDIVYNNAVEVENVAICGSRGWLYNSQSDDERKIVLREKGRLERSIIVAEEKGLKPIVFMHYPPMYNGIECTEILDVLISHNIKNCYYGHIHGGIAANYATVGEYKGIKFSLVSADYLKFTPKLVKK